MGKEARGSRNLQIARLRTKPATEDIRAVIGLIAPVDMVRITCADDRWAPPSSYAAAHGVAQRKFRNAGVSPWRSSSRTAATVIMGALHQREIEKPVDPVHFDLSADLPHREPIVSCEIADLKGKSNE